LGGNVANRDRNERVPRRVGSEVKGEWKKLGVALFGVFDQILARNHKTIVAHVYREQCSAGSLGTMKIEIHAPSKPAVVVSLLLAILALIGYFVDSSFAFSIAMFAYLVGALGVLVEI